MITARDLADLRRAAEIGASMGPGRKTIWAVGGVALVHAPFLVALLDHYETTGGPVSTPEPVDVEAARGLFANDVCPMTDHADDEPRPLEVVETFKLCAEESATEHREFLGRKVPVRPMVVLRCTDEDCQFGREIVEVVENGTRQTYAGLGYVDTPAPRAGE